MEQILIHPFGLYNTKNSVWGVVYVVYNVCIYYKMDRLARTSLIGQIYANSEARRPYNQSNGKLNFDMHFVKSMQSGLKLNLMK